MHVPPPHSLTKEFATPSALMLDPRLTPLDRNGWQVLNMLKGADDLSPLTSYNQLRRYLTTAPLGQRAGFATATRTLLMLRLTGWVSLVGQWRAPCLGAFSASCSKFTTPWSDSARPAPWMPAMWRWSSALWNPGMAWLTVLPTTSWPLEATLNLAHWPAFAACDPDHEASGGPRSPKGKGAGGIKAPAPLPPPRG
ncbi:hypothetical protein CTS44_13223 [Comamonas thiooxydans]|nr:hypothetical protein CTS44_13223 [Comamonas thiooxydans]